MSQEPVHELARDIEHYLGLLSKLYVKAGERLKLAIIANARVTVREGWNYDNWNGGTYGHALYLALPTEMFVECVSTKDELQSALVRDINGVHNVPNESIDAVFLEAQRVDSVDWRAESGAVIGAKRPVPTSTADRIWAPKGYRVFLSHKTEVKRETADVKAKLQMFGVSSFVAHEDIHPTKAWQDEIESALMSMDAFVALLTDGFHDSLWTDQEVGFAVGRGVPIIAIRLGRDPYGFIGKFQALSCGWDAAPLAIVKLLMTDLKMVEAYVTAVQGCKSFDSGNTLAQVLPAVQSLTAEQASRLVDAYNTNIELRGSFGFNGTKPRLYGDGLQAHLLRTTGRRYEYGELRELRVASKS
jgi:hypothetical protein